MCVFPSVCLHLSISVCLSSASVTLSTCWFNRGALEKLTENIPGTFNKFFTTKGQAPYCEICGYSSPKCVSACLSSTMDKRQAKQILKRNVSWRCGFETKWDNKCNHPQILKRSNTRRCQHSTTAACVITRARRTSVCVCVSTSVFVRVYPCPVGSIAGRCKTDHREHS